MSELGGVGTGVSSATTLEKVTATSKPDDSGTVDLFKEAAIEARKGLAPEKPDRAVSLRNVEGLFPKYTMPDANPDTVTTMAIPESGDWSPPPTGEGDRAVTMAIPENGDWAPPGPGVGERVVDIVSDLNDIASTLGVQLDSSTIKWPNELSMHFDQAGMLAEKITARINSGDIKANDPAAIAFQGVLQDLIITAPKELRAAGIELSPEIMQLLAGAKNDYKALTAAMQGEGNEGAVKADSGEVNLATQVQRLKDQASLLANLDPVDNPQQFKHAMNQIIQIAGSLNS